jgi:hypothetical protein
MAQDTQDTEKYMTTTQAMAYLKSCGLKASRVKMAEWLKYNVLPWERDPLDARNKLIPVSALEELRRQQERKAGRRVTDPKAMVA